MKKITAVYLVWAAATYVFMFARNGLDADNMTHLALLLVLSVTVLAVRGRTGVTTRRPGTRFIVSGVLLAAVGEGCYMISRPFQPSLLITAGMPAAQMVRNYVIDLMFTLPAYVVIFAVIWRLINTYRYERWEYILVFALGQALGDGNQAFLHAPVLLAFIPYVMVNYHAMNVVPYLMVESVLPAPRSESRWRLVAGVSEMVVTYLVCGSILVALARAAKLA